MFKVTLTSVTVPPSPDTVIVDGKALAFPVVPLPGTEIEVVLENVPLLLLPLPVPWM